MNYVLSASYLSLTLNSIFHYNQTMFQYYLNCIKKIFSFTKKALLVTVVFVAIITLFSHFINKDKVSLISSTSRISPIEQNRKEIYKNINDPQLNKTKSGKASIAIYRIMICGMMGEACTDRPEDGDINYNKSILGFMSNIIILPFKAPPASGVYWAYSGLQNAGLISKSYAAEGIGFAAISPFMNLWKIFRDLSYMLLVLVLIGIGFMIMFRMKINPQTIISVENSLPKIVVSLILITFSFAIAGFLIDLMYIIIAISISLLSNNNLYYSAVEFQQKYLNGSFSTISDSLAPNAINNTTIPWLSGVGFFIGFGNDVINILPRWLNGLLRSAIGGIASYGLVKFLHNNETFSRITESLDNIMVATFGVGKLPSGVMNSIWLGLSAILAFAIGFFLFPQLIVGVLIGITAILILFRIFFMVIKAYLQIILFIIFAPIFMLFEAIPGRNAFSYWIKNLFAEILTFPLLIIFFIVGYIIVNTYAAPTSNIWTPPFLYGIDATTLSAIFGISFLFLIPDLVKMVKELMGVKPLPVSIGLGTLFAGAGAVVGGGLGLAGQYGSLALAFPALRGKMGTLPGIGKIFREPEKKPGPGDKAQEPSHPAGGPIPKEQAY